MKNDIPAGLVLETDPKINALFPPRWKFFTANCLDPIAHEEYMIACDESAMRSGLDDYVLQPSCKWGRSKIARFINRYVSYYRDKRKPDRELILAHLESVAKENHVALPTPEVMLKPRKQRAQLVTSLVDQSRPDRVRTYKAYFDGSNVVAYIPGENKAAVREVTKRTKWDELFEKEYALLKKKQKYGENGKTQEQKDELRKSLEAEIVTRFYTLYDYDDSTENECCLMFVNRKLYNMSAAYGERKKRFHRKKDQVRWTAWWTITYNDEIFDSEQQFRKTLLNYFRNKSVRNQWRIMGVFEHGEDNGRLHFHGFFYIPEGQEVGELVEAERYSTKRQCLEKYIENTEIREKFGINKYEDISEAMRSDINAMANYTAKMLHYMEKGEKVYYSRHIPSEFLIDLKDSDIMIAFCITCKRPVKRYVVWKDSVVRTDTEMLYVTQDPYQNGLLEAA